MIGALSDFSKALAQLADKPFRRVFWRGVGLTFLLFVGVCFVFTWLVGLLNLDQISFPLIGTIGWLDNLASFGVILGLIVASIFLMVPTASLMTSFFLDEIADSVETRYYPQLRPAGEPGFWEGILDSVAFFGVMILANLLALGLSLIVGPLAFLVFWAMNGYLLGREYFQLAAIRREGRDGAKALYKSNRMRVWISGLLMAAPLTIPFINFFIPVLGAATFTHLYHRVKGEKPARVR